MVKLDEKDLYQFLIAEFRYAVKRDNHLAPDACVQHVKDYLPYMAKQWSTHTAKQLSEEIIEERLLNSRCFNDAKFKFEKDFAEGATRKQLNNDYVWEDLLVFLTDYLETLPYNVDRYMKFIYGHMTYSEGINYYSTEMYNKLIADKEKD